MAEGAEDDEDVVLLDVEVVFELVEDKIPVDEVSSEVDMLVELEALVLDDDVEVEEPVVVAAMPS